MVRWWVIRELKGYRRTQSLSNSRYYLGVYLDGLKKSKKTLNHYNWCSAEILTGHFLYTNRERGTDCSVVGDRHSITVALSKQACGHIITLNNNAQRCQLYRMQAKADLP